MMFLAAFLTDTGSITSPVDSIASHGILGALVVILGFLFLKKDAELTKERADRLADAKQVFVVVDKLADVSEALQKTKADLEAARLQTPQPFRRGSGP